MTPEQCELWRRIEAHELDQPGALAPFSLRLAREQRWSLGFTRRAIEEYRRFAFLAMAAGHPVSPSDAIDQVWHTHLLYTHDYWEEFCPRVLQGKLHHGPSRGGAGESGKFRAWYAETRASYARFFGAPPADLWPETPEHPAAVRVDARRFWIVPKPDWRRWLGRLRVPSPAAEPHRLAEPPAQPGNRPASPTLVLLLAAGLAALVPKRLEAAGFGSWPFDLRGPDFLAFYGWFALAGFGMAWGLRVALDRPARSWVGAPTLDAYEIAELGGGKDRVFAAVLATLVHRKLIEISARTATRTSTAAPAGLHVLESVVLAAVSTGGTSLLRLRADAEAALAANRITLVEHELIPGGSWTSAQWTSLLAAAVVPVVGAIKIGVGVARGKPVAFLIILTALALVVTLAAFARRPRLTALGARVLAELRDRHPELREFDPGERPAADPTLAIAFGLFGWEALHGTALAALRQDLLPPASAVSAGTWTSGCGGTGDGGGSGCGGGGGDGGGGGCGGCGGGH